MRLAEALLDGWMEKHRIGREVNCHHVYVLHEISSAEVPFSYIALELVDDNNKSVASIFLSEDEARELIEDLQRAINELADA